MVRQRSDNECGAAAWAMMLQRWSLPASGAEDILHAVPVEKGHGIAAGALRDFARQKGLQAFVIRGEFADLLKEVAANRPILVGLVQRYSDRARLHYEVVAGINPTQRRVLLMDPGRGLRQDGYDGFGTEWEAAGKVALVILRS
jgi:predicted double-glycine peptidase